jgi:lysophospholipase L1-like esterase
MQLLPHTSSLLNNGEPVTIGYFGGSITEGYGASDYESTSWRARTTRYLRKRFPDVTVTEVNATIGGTGSDLGAFRCGEDLLRHKPDLVFVEFAVNDYERAEGLTLRAMEGIVLQIRRATPDTDIVFVYTATKSMDEAYSRREVPLSVMRHARVAARYAIPEINVGKALYETVSTEHGGDWRAVTIDDVHPNDDGYALYARQVTGFLEAALATDSGQAVEAPLSPRTMPAPLTERPLDAGILFDAWDATQTTNWRRDEETLSGRYPHRLTADGPEAGGLKLSFHGDVIGLYWLVAPDSGDIEWSLDGSAWRRRSSWDQYALHFTRASYVLLSDDLAPGPHELSLRVCADHDPGSAGTRVCIGAFLINGGPQ